MHKRLVRVVRLGYHLFVANHTEILTALPTRFVVTAWSGYGSPEIMAELGAELTDAGRKTACALAAKYLCKRSVRICTVDAAGKLIAT